MASDPKNAQLHPATPGPVLTRMSLICWQLGVSSRHGYHSVWAGICTNHSMRFRLEILIEKIGDGTTHISSVIQRSNPLQTILISGGYLVDICRVTAPWLWKPLGFSSLSGLLAEVNFPPASRWHLAETYRRGELLWFMAERTDGPKSGWDSESLSLSQTQTQTLSATFSLCLSISPSVCLSVYLSISSVVVIVVEGVGVV